MFITFGFLIRVYFNCSERSVYKVLYDIIVLVLTATKIMKHSCIDSVISITLNSLVMVALVTDVNNRSHVVLCTENLIA